MSQRFQFSLGRLFGAITLVAIAAMSAANLARASNNAGISAVSLWMVTTCGACGAAGGILISKSVLRGLFVGAVIGSSPVVVVNLALLVFDEWLPAGLGILLLGALVVAAFFAGIHFERERHRRATAMHYVQVVTIMPQSVTTPDDPAVQTDEVAIPAPGNGSHPGEQ